MANDLATGLGLGLKAASMAGAWDESEKDRALREAMAQRQHDFTAEQAGLDRTYGTSEREAGEVFKGGEAEKLRRSREDEAKKGRDLQEDIYEGNLRIKKLGMLWDQSSRNRDYDQRNRIARQKMEWESKVLGYQSDLKLWQDKRAEGRHAAGIRAQADEAKLKHERTQELMKEQVMMPFHPFNEVIAAKTKEHNEAQAAIMSQLDALPALERLNPLNPVSSGLANEAILLKQRYDIDIADLNKQKEREMKKGGPTVDLKHIVVGRDPLTGAPIYGLRAEMGGVNGSPAQVKEILDQLNEMNQGIKNKEKTQEDPLQGTPGSVGSGIPPVGAPNPPPGSPGYKPRVPGSGYR